MAKSKQTIKKTTPKKEAVLTKEKFLKILNQVIRPVSEKQKLPVKGKSKTSE